MIKCSDGMVRCDGNAIILQVDLVCIVKALLDKNIIDDEELDNILRIAKLSNEDADKEAREAKKEICKILEGLEGFENILESMISDYAKRKKEDL